MNLALKKVLVLLAVRVDSQHCWLHVYLNKPVNAHTYIYIYSNTNLIRTRLVSLGVCTIYIPLIHYNALHTAAQ